MSNMKKKYWRTILHAFLLFIKQNDFNTSVRAIFRSSCAGLLKMYRDLVLLTDKF